MQKLKFCLVLLCTSMFTSCQSKSAAYFGYVTNGDKPAIGLKLDLTNGRVKSGEFSILSPDYPDNQDGVHYPLTHVREANGKIYFHVTLRNGDQMIESAYSAKILSKSDTAWEVQLLDDPPSDSTPLTLKLMRTDRRLLE